MIPALPPLSFTGGAATSGDVGDAGAVGISVGGINTGTQSTIPPWLLLVGIAVALWIFLRR